MKRILSILLIVLLSFSLFTGCSFDDSPSNLEPNDDTSSSQGDQSNDSSSEESIGFTVLNEDLIDTDNVMGIIEELTSERYLGRLSGTEGNELAVNYVVEYFKEIGLQNPEGLEDYKQYFPHPVRITNSAPKLELIDENGDVVEEYVYLEDFNPITSHPSLGLSGTIEGETYYISDASEISKDNEEILDKIVIIPQNISNQLGIHNMLQQFSTSKIRVKGAILERDYMKVAPHANHQATSSKKPLGSYFTPEGFEDFIEKAKDGVTVRLSMDYSREYTESANVIGVIPGTDEELKDEYVIICGHLDHVGDNKNGTYNPGALDNASGTASVMEIARILTTSKVKPKKTIVFIGFNGEEEGLFGSRYYVTKSLYPLGKTTVINLDMVGSKSIIPLEICTGTKAGNDLRTELYEYAKVLGIDSVQSVSQGSDHAPFDYTGAEAVMLINIDLENGYHTPGDTIETVDGDRIKEVIKLVLYYLDKKAY